MNKTLMLKQLSSILKQNKSILVVNGNTVDCGKTVMESENSYTFFGAADNYKFSILADRTETGDVEVDSTCVVDGITFRVLGVDQDSLGLGTTLHLGAPLGQGKSVRS
jgi:hypothetical protein